MKDRTAREKRVGIVIYDGVEVLDFCGPYAVFTTTRLDETRREEEASPFVAGLVAEDESPVTTAAGMRVLPDWTFHDCSELDILVVPGGRGSRQVINDEQFITWLTIMSRKVEIVASVCTGALILAKAGLLDGRRATTHWRSIARMRELFPAVEVVEDVRVVRDGPVITSAGISAGIDLGLVVVSSYFGEAVARAAARNMEYVLPEGILRPERV